jgi:hypothetical protein
VRNDGFTRVVPFAYSYIHQVQPELSSVRSLCNEIFQQITRGRMSLRRMWMVNLPGSRRRAVRLWMGMFSLNVGWWYASRPWRQRNIYR